MNEYDKDFANEKKQSELNMIDNYSKTLYNDVLNLVTIRNDPINE